MQAYKVDHGNLLLDRTACKINKLTMQNKFRFSIGYLFYAPELEEPCFLFFPTCNLQAYTKKEESLVLRSHH